MLEMFWWGSVFLLAVPVMLALLILGPRVLPEYRDQNAGRLDLPIAVLSIAAVLAVIYGFKGIAQDGVQASFVAAIAVGVVLGVVWVRRQKRIPDPMIDISLFRIRAFNAALSVNFLAIFVAIGYFLFIAQYLQLVLGLSPLEAGLWSLPSALGFVVGSQITPRISGRVGPRNLIAGGLAVAAVGMVMLTQVGGTHGLPLLVAASLVISLGFAPVFGLTTELIVGSAPPERAGAASGISETGAELGGALGIAILGSIGVATYRGQLSDSLPTSTPADVVDTARDTLGAAIGAAGELPAPLGDQVIEAAHTAFVNGMHVVAAIGTVLAVAVAAVAWHALRAHGPATTAADEQNTAAALEPVPEPVA
jgi:DHA2 family multidrug resistance protein-like MFS transporter